jgi:hypothetical protein
VSTNTQVDFLYIFICFLVFILFSFCILICLFLFCFLPVLYLYKGFSCPERNSGIWYRKQSPGCHAMNSINEGRYHFRWFDLISPVSTGHPTWARVWVSAVMRYNLHATEWTIQGDLRFNLHRFTRCHSWKMLNFMYPFQCRFKWYNHTSWGFCMAVNGPV